MKRGICGNGMNILILSVFLLVTVFNVTAWCDSLITWSSGWDDPYEFGTVLTGTTTCKSVQWTNRKDGQLQCDSGGCVYKPLPTRSVSFSGFSVSPTSATLPAYGTVNLNICATPGNGDYAGYVTATVSPAFEGGGNTDTAYVHIKGIPSLVTAEPLGATLTFDTIQVGNTQTKTFNVCNYNTISATITSISINNSNFTVASGVNSVISPNYCKPIGINFAPQTTGTSNGTININTTGGNTTYPCSGYSPAPLNITASVSGGNGTIAPANSTINYGSNATLIITPASGYHLATLIDNGTDVTGSVNWQQHYTITNVTANHNVIATFSNTYSVTASTTGGNGTITPASAIIINGNSATITITPASGYALATLTDNGTDVSGNVSGNAYTITNVTANHNVIATFARYFNVYASVTGDNGSITPASSSIIYGRNATLSITPNSGYTLDKLLDNGVDVTSLAWVSTPTTFTYNISNITANHTIQVSFKTGTIPIPASAVPAISPPVVLFLVAGMSGILYWQGRKRSMD